MQQTSRLLIEAETTRIPGKGDRLVAAGVISAHTIEHIYMRGFLILLPEIQVALGLPIFQTFLLDGVRSLASGLTSMASGLFVDMFQHRTGQILAFAMLLMGVGYLLVGAAPSYGIIVLALMVASAGGALWHPPALALLSHRFPRRRGLLVSLHRSTGNLGEMAAPWIVLGLLVVLSWQGTVYSGVPLVLLIAALVFLFLRNAGGTKVEGPSFRENFDRKMLSLSGALREDGMLALLTVSALRGVGDRALILGILLYLKDEVGLGTGWVTFHLALLTTAAIVAGPIIGAASDRMGRKPIIVFIMGVSIIFPLAMVAAGSGPGFTAAVAMFGLFIFSVNSLTQAAAMDLVAGRGLEGSIIGLMWGVGTVVGFPASLLAGALADFQWDAVFYFASASFALGFLVSLVLPSTGGSGPASPDHRPSGLVSTDGALTPPAR